MFVSTKIHFEVHQLLVRNAKAGLYCLEVRYDSDPSHIHMLIFYLHIIDEVFVRQSDQSTV